METLQQLNTSREQARMTKVTFMVTKRNRFGSNQRRRFVFDFDALELQTFDKNGRSMKKRIAFKQFVSVEIAQSRDPDNPNVILKVIINLRLVLLKSNGELDLLNLHVSLKMVESMTHISVQNDLDSNL